MRRQWVAGSVVLGTASVGLGLWLRPAWMVVGIAAVLAAGLWRLGQCSHPRPLGLLPPVTDEHGNRQPAQWFCGRCGHRFPASFEHAPAPVQRFHGYDESKAREAAKRAADLEQRQRQLALRRAGMTRRSAEVAPTRQEPVPIHGRRLAG